MLVVLRPEAEHELLEAQTWYESKALGLGFPLCQASCRLKKLKFKQRGNNETNVFFSVYRTSAG